jgi:6-bladed beta-propeller
MKTYYAIYALCFFLLSCSNGGTNKKEKVQSRDSVLTLHFPTIDFQKEYPKKDIVLQDIADITYIPLETNDSALLSSRPFTIMTRDYIVVHNKKAVCFFNKDGSYSHSFNHIGESGMEYASIYGLCINEEANEVFVYDVPIFHHIQVYDYHGAYKRTISLPWAPPSSSLSFSGAIHDFDKDYIFAEDVWDVNYIAKAGEKTSVNPIPYYKISKNGGNLINLPFSIKKRIRDGLGFTNDKNEDEYVNIPLFMSPIAKMGSDMIIAEYSLDTVYTYQDSIFKPFAVRLNHYDEDIPILATVDIVSDRYLFWYTVKKDIDVERRYISDPITYVFDKYTGECFEVGIVNRDGISSDDYNSELTFKYRLSGNLHVVPKNYAIQAYPADFLVEQYQAGKLSGKLKEIASKLTEEDNPVLMLAKFKVDSIK